MFIKNSYIMTIYIINKILTNWVASYFSSLHTTLLHGRAFSSTAGDKWRITFAQQLTVLSVKLVSRLTYRGRKQNRLETCTMNSLTALAKKLTHSPGNIVHYTCNHMCLPSHTCHHWVNIQGHTHTPQNRVQCSDWVEEGYRRAGKETRRGCSGCWVGM